MRCPECSRPRRVGSARCECGLVFVAVMPARRLRPLRGAVVGAVIGGVGRFAVACLFLAYCERQGATFFSGAGQWARYCGLSAVIGVAIGGLAGVTCRPLLGAAVGGVGSGASCLCLFVAPMNLLMVMSGGGSAAYVADRLATVGGLAGMVVIGLLAGAVGGLAGRSDRLW